MRNSPRPYDLSLSSERLRLFRELRGYLETCKRHHHGTDFEGRQHALDALVSMTAGMEIGTAK